MLGKEGKFRAIKEGEHEKAHRPERGAANKGKSPSIGKGRERVMGNLRAGGGGTYLPSRKK